jgi:hypothetical protein
MKLLPHQRTPLEHVLGRVQISFTFEQLHSLPQSISSLLSSGSSLVDDVTS